LTTEKEKEFRAWKKKMKVSSGSDETEDEIETNENIKKSLLAARQERANEMFRKLAELRKKLEQTSNIEKKKEINEEIKKLLRELEGLWSKYFSNWGALEKSESKNENTETHQSKKEPKKNVNNQSQWRYHAENQYNY